MAKEFLTDEQVEREIERLRKSKKVALAQQEMRIKQQRREVLYNLQSLERRGKELEAAGYTMEMLQEYGVGEYADI